MYPHCTVVATNFCVSGNFIEEILYVYRFPSLRLSPEISSPNVHPGISSPLDSRMSSYDNVEGRNGYSHDIIASSNHNHHGVTLHHNHPTSNHHCASQISDNDDTQTIFSEPWDSSRWENLLHLDHTENGSSVGSNSVVQVMGQTPLLGPEEDDTVCGTNTNRIHSNRTVNGCTTNNGHINRTKSFKERLDPLLCEYCMLCFYLSIINRLIFVFIKHF